jgi:PAT family beta-lactamase induction signal transducer AmpG
MKLSDYSKKCCIGFSYGMSFPLTLIILDYWLKDIGVSNTTIGLFTMLHLPFTTKFIWGVFIENYDIPFLSKKFSRNLSWILFSHLLLIGGVIGMACSNPEKSLVFLIISTSIVAIADGCKDVVLYPYQINNAPKKKFGYIASVVSLGHKIGMISIKVLTLHIAHFYDWKTAYLVAAFLIFVVMILISRIEEPYVSHGKSRNVIVARENIFLSIKKSFLHSVYVPMKTLLGQKGGVRILGILMLYKGSDFMMQKMSRPFCISLGFTKLEIANIVQLVGSIAVVIGGFFGGYVIRKIGIRRAMIALGIAHSFSFFSYLLLVTYGHNSNVLYFIILFEAITGGGISTAFLAFLYNLAKTGTQYAIFWAFHELGGMFFMSISGMIADTIGWSNYFTIVPMVFVPSLVLLSKKSNGKHQF